MTAFGRFGSGNVNSRTDDCRAATPQKRVDGEVGRE
jgi:hypothetical protein